MSSTQESNSLRGRQSTVRITLDVSMTQPIGVTNDHLVDFARRDLASGDVDDVRLVKGEVLD